MPHMNFPKLDRCALCDGAGPLKNSHLLPDSLYRRLREGEGRFFAVSKPRQALQRGAVAKLLCLDCEQRFSKWEGAFASAFLDPVHPPRLPISYGPWLRLFATSISWRALAYMAYATPKPYASPPEAAKRLLQPLPRETHAAASQALERWGEELKTGPAPAGQSDQHLIFLNGQTFEHELVGVVGFTTCRTADYTAVFAQLGPVCVLGMIEDREQVWKSTRVQSVGGIFPVETQTVPPSFGTWLRKYFANLQQVGQEIPGRSSGDEER